MLAARAVPRSTRERLEASDWLLPHYLTIGQAADATRQLFLQRALPRGRRFWVTKCRASAYKRCGFAYKRCGFAYKRCASASCHGGDLSLTRLPGSRHQRRRQPNNVAQPLKRCHVLVNGNRYHQGV